MIHLRQLARFTRAFAAVALVATFHGYPCTDDCSGHKAGYAWVLKQGITDEADCVGKSRSFVEGCWAAVEDTQTQNEPDLDHQKSQ